jgi:hypothetical protein
MVTDDVYMQIANAKAGSGGNRIVDGAYTHAVKNLILEKKRAAIFFIAELVVVTASPVDVPAEFWKEHEKVPGYTFKPNAVGADVSFLCDMSADAGPGNAKSLLLALDGTPEENVNPAAFAQMIKAATGKPQPLRGALVKCTTYRKPIKSGKNAGQPFTGCNWEFIPQKPDEVRARRNVLDAGQLITL